MPNSVLAFLPTSTTAVKQTSAIKATMKAYSTIVAASSPATSARDLAHDLATAGTPPSSLW